MTAVARIAGRALIELMLGILAAWFVSLFVGPAILMGRDGRTDGASFASVWHPHRVFVEKTTYYVSRLRWSV